MSLLHFFPTVKLPLFYFPYCLFMGKARSLSCRELIISAGRYKQTLRFWCSWSWAGPKDSLPHVPRDTSAVEYNSKLATASHVLGVKDHIPKSLVLSSGHYVQWTGRLKAFADFGLTFPPGRLRNTLFLTVSQQSTFNLSPGDSQDSPWVSYYWSILLSIGC